MDIGSNLSFTERIDNVRIEKTWTTINRLTTLWKSHLFDKIKQDFFQAEAMLVLLD